MNAKQIDKALRRFERLNKRKPDKLTRFVKSIDRQLDRLLK